MKPLKVSQLNLQIKSLLENTFLDICVCGEISKVTYHNSGHIYFDIKDTDSKLSCVMFAGNARELKFKLESGNSIVIYGSMSVYVARGDYQLLCKKIVPDGIGELSVAYEQLKEKLSKKGYFDKNKSITRFPKRIAIITSATGAALQDMLKIATKRWQLCKITLFDSIVQGESAKFSIAKNIALADSLNFDVIIIGRGGGSIEDMWAFNEELVADAIFNAKTPIVSAVGHEIDYFISDFVADLRAPTPSAAMEMILPDSNELLRYVSELLDSLNYALSKHINIMQKELDSAYSHIGLFSFDRIYEIRTQEISYMLNSFYQFLESRFLENDLLLDNFKQTLEIKKQNFIKSLDSAMELLSLQLESKNPAALSKSGFAQIFQNGKVCNLSNLNHNASFMLSDLDTSLNARIE